MVRKKRYELKLNREKVLVSACLVGVPCRYNGTHKYHPQVLELLKTYELVIICPEVLAGFSTPRPPAFINKGDAKDILQGNSQIISKGGDDYTTQFLQGAHSALQIAIKNNIKKAYLQQRSPSCGCGKIYNYEKIIKGNGVFAELLIQNGVEVYPLEESDSLTTPSPHQMSMKPEW